MNRAQFLFQLSVGTVTACAMPAHAIKYLENFSSPGGFTRPAVSVGWKGFWDQGRPSIHYNLAELAEADGIQYNSPLGNPAGVNNSPAGAESGVVFWSPSSITNVTFATQEFAGIVDSADIGAILWDYSLDAPSTLDGELMKRALVQVGGSATDTDNWYVSDPMIVLDTAGLSAGGPVGGFYQGRWQTAAVAAAGNWIRVPFYDFANEVLAWPLSAAPKTESDFAAYEGYTFYKGPLPDGIVHGFGVFIDNRRGGNLWLDNFTIIGVEEVPLPPVPAISLEGDTVLVSFDSSGDTAYQLLKSTDGMNSYFEVGAMEWGNDDIKTFVDAGGRPETGNVFYRVTASDGMQRMGGMHTQSQIEDVRNALAAGETRVTDAYAELADQTALHLAHIPQPPGVFDVPGAYVDIVGHNTAVALLSGDAWAAYALALRYQLDDSPDRVMYADKAIEILNAWAINNHATSGHDGDLVMAYAGVGMIFAAELLSESDRWAEADLQQFEGWVRTVFLGSCSLIRGRQNNWGDWGTLGAIASHRFLGEKFALDADITQLQNKIDTSIQPNGVMPLEVNRGRGGIWYTYFSLAPLTAAAHILYNDRLVDFFNYVPPGGGGIRQALDYLFTYCLEPDSWPHYDGDDLINPPTPDSPFYGSLFEAMSGMYNDAGYAEWLAAARPVMNHEHHFSWAVPSLMRNLLP